MFLGKHTRENLRALWKDKWAIWWHAKGNECDLKNVFPAHPDPFFERVARDLRLWFLMGYVTARDLWSLKKYKENAWSQGSGDILDIFMSLHCEAHCIVKFPRSWSLDTAWAVFHNTAHCTILQNYETWLHFFSPFPSYFSLVCLWYSVFWLISSLCIFIELCLYCFIELLQGIFVDFSLFPLAYNLLL